MSNLIAENNSAPKTGSITPAGGEEVLSKAFLS